MRAKDISSLEQKVMDILPITQAEVWKTLGIGRRECSKLVTTMLDENLIKKKRVNNTFLLERKNGEITKNNKLDFSLLLSKDGIISPCCGCRKECKPHECILLVEWLK